MITIDLPTIDCDDIRPTIDDMVYHPDDSFIYKVTNFINPDGTEEPLTKRGHSAFSSFRSSRYKISVDTFNRKYIQWNILDIPFNTMYQYSTYDANDCRRLIPDMIEDIKVYLNKQNSRKTKDKSLDYLQIGKYHFTKANDNNKLPIIDRYKIHPCAIIMGIITGFYSLIFAY